MFKYVREFWNTTEMIGLGLFLFLGLSLSVFYIRWPLLFIFLIGIIFFGIMEYVIHRFLFHGSLPEKIRFLQPVKDWHDHHHQHPSELKGILLPAWLTLPMLLLLVLAVQLIMRDITFSIAFVTGVSGTLLYHQWRHFSAHRPIEPFTPIGKRLKVYHLQHHTINKKYWFGLTNPLMDLLLGTYRNPKKQAQKQSSRRMSRSRATVIK
ncbi:MULTISPECIES: sterol desaturase family protein [Bacillus]|jgi:sterol desaturase/sphingolipid hydroxylase (fatty acid hydroxylase superfamily)|uniref:sterol desaturase family protein n=1 Tax=Bacillus TaxID=1386 RepID=UPI00065E0516|nr:sterol desaturase family protein [Bacillus smithii]AKP48343.1 Putative fatty acid hydroxylase [Bacillus smithii]MED4885218.1 sterol desaturase family protein [Bacillus smithii]MED4927887.1 sterol desaturase family protein [Bacillus smithii]